VARDVIEGLMIDRGLRRAYARRATDEAEHSSSEPYAADARVDLTDLPTFTIDPDDAKDFDDAISARREKRGRVRVWIQSRT
jgi:ribonuclease R